MAETKKISAGQFMLLLLLARVMHMMIFRAQEFSSGVAMMLGLLCSTAIEAILAIPAVWYFNSGGPDPVAEIGGKYSTWIKLLYSLYFTVIAAGTVSLFTQFLTSEFSMMVKPLPAIILLVLAAVYCACQGIEGLGRAGAVVFWLFVILFVSMAAVNEGSFEWLNVRPLTAGDSKQFWNYFIETLSSSWWLPMLCALGMHLRSGVIKAAYGYLVLKLIIVEALLLLVTLVLWRYVNVLGYPIFALGAYAKSDFIQRFDAINMLIWAINSVLVVGVYIFISAKPAKNHRPAAIFFAVLTAVCAWLAYKIGLEFDEDWFLMFKMSGVVLLGVVLPAAACVKLIIKRSAEK